MAGLQEQALWDADIYQIEQTDPVIGGPPNLAQGQGITNVPHQALANRTTWLKAKVEALQTALANIDVNADIQAAIDALIDGAPGALDTLNELAQAVQSNDNDIVSLLGQIASAATPVAAVSAFAVSTPPAGWLECDGTALSRTAYQLLFDAIGTSFGAGDGATTFNIPDLRGEFLRSWDNGRGVDVGRLFGTVQGDAIRNITGGAAYFNSLATYTWSGALYQKSSQVTGDSNNGSATAYEIGLDASRVVPTANENRPRNVSLMFCIKY